MKNFEILSNILEVKYNYSAININYNDKMDSILYYKNIRININIKYM